MPLLYFAAANTEGLQLAVTNPNAFRFVLPLGCGCNEHREGNSSFILPKWGFAKLGPVGQSVPAGLAAEPAESCLGEVQLLQARSPGTSGLLETFPQLSGDKMMFFTLNANGVPLPTGLTGKVMKKTPHCL